MEKFPREILRQTLLAAGGLCEGEPDGKVRECIPEQMGEDMTAKSKTDPVLLRVRLEKLERDGIKLFLNGAPSTTDYIVETCINEETVYMPDYVTDECGKVKEIRYDRISSEQ